MNAFGAKVKLITRCLSECWLYGAPERVGDVGDEALFILDGVGGFQFTPAMVRLMLREQERDLCTVLFDWQFGLVGEIWTDLMWHRRNQLMGRKLARKLLAFRREHPTTTLHLLAISGGAGVALFACERLRGRRIIDTLVLGCPAMSPDYNLAPALSAVNHAYALVSRRDSVVLGFGTRLFGTTDRRHVRAAGMVGFVQPAGLCGRDRQIYQRMQQIRWTPSLRALDHGGGHSGWISPAFLREHLLPLLHQAPLLPVEPIPTTSG